MTRGSEVTWNCRQVRDNGNFLILRLNHEAEKMKMSCASRIVNRFALMAGLCMLNQGVGGDLTPGPQGPGED